MVQKLFTVLKEDMTSSSSSLSASNNSSWSNVGDSTNNSESPWGLTNSDQDLLSSNASRTDLNQVQQDKPNGDKYAALIELSEKLGKIHSVQVQQPNKTGPEEFEHSNKTGLTEVQPSDQQVDQPKSERTYLLAWTIRDAIILHLSHYSQLFCGENAEEEIKNQIANINLDLYRVLAGLPPKSKGPDGSGPNGSGQSSKVALDLGFNGRLQIISTLFTNQDLLVDLESCSEEARKNMVERNNKLIFDLLKLPISTSNDSANKVAPSTSKGNIEAKEPELAKEVARLNQVVQRSQSELMEQATMNSLLSKELERLGKEIQKIKSGADLGGVVETFNGKLNLNVDQKNGEFEYELNEFEYELNDVEDFLATPSAVLCSEHFFVNNTAWQAKVKTNVDGENRFLSIYLYPKRITPGNVSIKAFYVLTILNQSGGENKTSKCTKDFGMNGLSSWGESKFISLDELRTGGYIKEDKIKIQVLLEVEVINSKNKPINCLNDLSLLVGP